VAEQAPEPQKKASEILEDLCQDIIEIDGMQCAICMDFIMICRTAVCGHSFCCECIHESLLRKRECPHCRKDIRKWSLNSSELIDKAVELTVKSKTEAGDPSDEKRWNERLKNFETWQKKHKLDWTAMKSGDQIDALDTEHIWCKAVIELKISYDTWKPPLILVHYEGWSRKYDEYMLMTSQKLAPSGTYTSRTDIPRYRMCRDSQAAVNFAHVLENARVDLQDQADAPVG
jgi:hypothetical protein